MNAEFHFPTVAPARGEPALRVLVLGAVYAVAVFFAVAFSPNMGFVAHRNIPTGHIASPSPLPTIGR